jgi:predicted nuclease of predicted toxin-antitoxin system
MSVCVYIDNDNINYMKYKDVLYNIYPTDVFYKIFLNEFDYSKIDDISKNKHKFIINQNNGKNTNDIALTIECMNDLHKSINMIIVSNDSDFLPLCKHIQEHGKKCHLLCEYNYKNIAYDNVKNIKQIYDDIQKAEYKKDEQERQIQLENRRRLENAKYSKNAKNAKNIDKIHVKNIYDNYFNNADINSISIDNIAKLYNTHKIKYKEYGRLKQYVIDFLPSGYDFSDNILYNI